MTEQIDKEAILTWVKQKEALVYQKPKTEYSEGVTDALNTVYKDITIFINSLAATEVKS